ncbi:MAG: MCE family protein [Actinomycetota bacterium]
MRRYVKPLAYAAVALTLLGAGALVAGGRSTDDGTYTVTAYFEKAIGLFEKSDVDILGVPVGTVTDIEPQGERVKVVMEISDEHKVPADAFAQIVPISVIADRYIQLAPVYEGGPALEDGAVIDLDRTQIPAELDDVFRQLKKLLDAIQPGKKGEPGALGELIVELDETLTDREDDLRGTLINTSELTRTLAGARGDISALIANLDQLFGTLATRAGSLGSLNRNFAVTMRTLAESRADLEGTLANLAGLTHEVGDLVRDHRGTLGRDLALAGRIASAILDNRASFEQSLQWLPVVAQGLSNAYHPPPINSVDIRDNSNAKFCEGLKEDIEGLPDPLKEALEDLVKDMCPGGGRPRSPAPADRATLVGARALLECEEGTRRVKRQVKRVEGVDGIPQDALAGVVRPLKEQLKRLARRCHELADAIDKTGSVDALLDDLLEGSEPGVLAPVDDAADEDADDAGLTGNAAGATVVPTADGGSVGEGLGTWVRGFLGFLGWSR